MLCKKALCLDTLRWQLWYSKFCTIGGGGKHEPFMLPYDLIAQCAGERTLLKSAPASAKVSRRMDQAWYAIGKIFILLEGWIRSLSGCSKWKLRSRSLLSSRIHLDFPIFAACSNLNRRWASKKHPSGLLTKKSLTHMRQTLSMQVQNEAIYSCSSILSGGNTSVQMTGIELVAMAFNNLEKHWLRHFNGLSERLMG